MLGLANSYCKKTNNNAQFILKQLINWGYPITRIARKTQLSRTTIVEVISKSNKTLKSESFRQLLGFYCHVALQRKMWLENNADEKIDLMHFT